MYKFHVNQRPKDKDDKKMWIKISLHTPWKTMNKKHWSFGKTEYGKDTNPKLLEKQM